MKKAKVDVKSLEQCDLNNLGWLSKCFQEQAAAKQQSGVWAGVDV